MRPSNPFVRRQSRRREDLLIVIPFQDERLHKEFPGHIQIVLVSTYREKAPDGQFQCLLEVDDANTF